ncbi:hypothetical protein KTO58_03275 [Chitinophaga pendula]|uniref:hypothetical protein n=1 Tax=Chitinophaga TaxID=79328 RepID=UPI000BAF66A1|nr:MULTISPECIES: hypothetical protein [Chitinophaga]ASZ14142.1 hypothetical protein CK934_25930 [Chitinophaga sp. MD30]UCJ08221.1 hypothetical protein KTO58_03275 [Chitinophaga pendula]
MKKLPIQQSLLTRDQLAAIHGGGQSNARGPYCTEGSSDACTAARCKNAILYAWLVCRAICVAQCDLT